MRLTDVMLARKLNGQPSAGGIDYIPADLDITLKTIAIEEKTVAEVIASRSAGFYPVLECEVYDNGSDTHSQKYIPIADIVSDTMAVFQTIGLYAGNPISIHISGNTTSGWDVVDIQQLAVVTI